MLPFEKSQVAGVVLALVMIALSGFSPTLKARGFFVCVVHDDVLTSDIRELYVLGYGRYGAAWQSFAFFGILSLDA